jgi:UDP-N-acetylmuramoylalanine--D-glutamate ligase
MGGNADRHAFLDPGRARRHRRFDDRFLNGKGARVRPGILDRLRGKRIHILGPSGTEGSTVAAFLRSQDLGPLVAHDLQTPASFPDAFRRTHPWMTPEAREAAIAEWLAGRIPVRWTDEYLRDIADADVIVTTQAWFRHPENEPVRARAARGVPLLSLTQLVFDLCPCSILGVTGTNGKFTVATLAHRMLEASGIRAHVSGNDRTHVPILDRLESIAPTDWLVLEISNRQLLGVEASPRIAVLTNVAPHHLDDHGTFENLVAAKARIFRWQAPSDIAVINLDDPPAAALLDTCPGRPRPFSRTRAVPDGAGLEDGWIVVSGERVVRAADLRVPGAHTLENALAACAAASAAGATAAGMALTLRAFEGFPYRLRLAADVDGVRYFEDSLGTNPAAAAAAIRAMDRPFILIAGGRRPGAAESDFALMREALASSPVRAVYLIGETAPVLLRAFRGLPAELLETRNLTAATKRASFLARAGEAVLLSPGCESFDQFKDYRERGDLFRDLVAALRPKSSA